MRHHHLAAAATLAIAVCLLATTTARAHRVDEYLQAATLDLSRDGITLTLRLTPGVAVRDEVLAVIDTDRDGTLSDAERTDYAAAVARDLTLTLDGRPLRLTPASAAFPSVDRMKEGTGEIVLGFGAAFAATADAAPTTSPASHQLTLQNRHLPRVSVYLANLLMPADTAIRVDGQHRSFDQSSYTLTWSVAAWDAPAAGARQEAAVNASWLAAFVRHGLHHILTGYDHLLFVTALTLGARSLWELVKLVSSFTVAHTLTMALGALHVLHAPASVVEPMIAGSIVAVAALNLWSLWRPAGRPRAAGPRLAAAFFFGLFHGLGFAGGLTDAMADAAPGATVLWAVLAFAAGVELGHQCVVLPLYALLKLALPRLAGAGSTARPAGATAARLSTLDVTVLRLGSAAVCVAGTYYLWGALLSPG